jgi:hypothetical protein
MDMSINKKRPINQLESFEKPSFVVLKSKQQNMKARGNIDSLEHLDINLLFPFVPSDNTLRKHMRMGDIRILL